MDLRWTNYFFELAAVTARMSRDPNTQVGAVIVRPDKTIAALGFNGFARGVDDDPRYYNERDTKLRRVVHAEMNAILTAREPLQGYTLYVRPLPPCPHCAGAVIQSGIKKIVWSGPEVPERWADDMAEAMKMFSEAGVEVERVEVAWVTASPQAVDGLVEVLNHRGELIGERDAEIVRLETKVSRLESELAAAERHDCRKMSAMGVGDGSGRLIVYGDYNSIHAARNIGVAAENLAKRVSGLQKQRADLESQLSEALRHDYRRMSVTCVGGGAGQLFVYGDPDSISAVRDIITAVDSLSKRVSELQKRRDELQEHNSELHERVVSLRDQIETPRRRVEVESAFQRSMEAWLTS